MTGAALPRLALLRPGLFDRFAQGFVADRTLEDLVADDEGRSAGRLEASGELEVALELAVAGRGGKLAGQADGRARPGERLGSGTPGLEQGVVEGLEAARLGCGEACAGGSFAVGTEHRPFAPHHLEPEILAEEPLDIAVALPAIAAGII